MILDRLENWALYADPGSRLGRAFHYLTHRFDPRWEDGLHDVEGDDIFALLQGYETRDPATARFEAHRRYIDIQLILKGGETINWAAGTNMPVLEEYDGERDVLFYEAPRRFSSLEMFPETFAVFYPADAHAPGLHLEGFDAVRKVVMKVRV